MILFGGCSRYELPSVPSPLAETPWEGATPLAEQPMTDSPPLHGAFTIEGELTQVSLDGPPLRLRAEVDIDVKKNGGLDILSMKVTPANLASTLNFQSAKADGMPTVWPLTALSRLHNATQLEEWLNRTVNVGGCASTVGDDTKFQFSTGSLGADVLHTYKTVSYESKVRRNEVSGFVHASEDGAMKAARLTIRRWARLTGKNCNLVQEERIFISSRQKPE